MIAIAGGGLSGLSCAWALNQAGEEFVLYEAAPVVGGRQRTTNREGFTLDHGFQVVLDSYDAVGTVCDIPALDPRWFESGALMHDGCTLRHLSSPLESPFEALFSATLSVKDKLLLGILGVELSLTPSENLTGRCSSFADVSTREFLMRRGFSDSFFSRFAQPFFGGVLLDNQLESSAGLFLNYFKKFLTGRAWIPAGGIQALPESLARRLPKSSMRFRSRVLSLDGETGGLVLESGEVVRAEKTILALDEPSLCRVLGMQTPQHWRGVSVVYFKTQASLYEKPCLVLPEGRDRVVRHFVQITNVAPEFAPEGWHLVSATVLDHNIVPAKHLAEAAEREICEVFPHVADKLEHLETIHVPYAVPTQLPGFAARKPFHDLPRNVYACGDWKLGASIQSAIQSGIETAHRVLCG